MLFRLRAYLLAMNIEELECDLSDALQNDDRSVLKKWIYLCREFRTWVAARIEEELLYEQGTARVFIYGIICLCEDHCVCLFLRRMHQEEIRQ